MSGRVPFHPDRPCQSSEEFVGRRQLIQRAFERLGTDDLQSFAVIGFAKDGKTSLLKYLQLSEVLFRYLGDAAAHYRFIYLDPKRTPIPDPEAFFRHLYTQWGMLLSRKPAMPAHSTSNIWAPLGLWTEMLQRADLRQVIILDNFNLIVTNPRFEVSFFEGLRSWFSTHPQVGCVVGSPMQLLDLSVPVELSGSPFFNIFDSYSLFPLEREEAESLLDTRIPEDVPKRAEGMRQLLDHFGYNPYPLHEAGSIWMQAAAAGENDMRAVIEEAYKKVLFYYEEIYSSLKSRQLESLKGLLGGERDKDREVRVDNWLVDRGWICRRESGPQFSCRALERFFREKMGLPRHKANIIKRLFRVR